MKPRALPLGWLLGLLCWSQLSAAASSNNEARVWLQRMAQALETRNYEGSYFHSTGNQSEILRIVHRNQGGKITERLVSQDGSGREYLRTNHQITTYMPDKRQVVVEVRADVDPLLNVIPEYQPELDAYYDFATGPVMQILERPAQMVVVQPRDDYRYGYRLWLDVDSAMPLKSQLLDRSGNVIEQMAFADLKLPETLPDSALKPVVNTTGFDWVHYETRKIAVEPGSVQWRVKSPPPGFKLTVNRIRPLLGTARPVRHLVYSDGLSSVSMFIEQDSGKSASAFQVQRVGSSYAAQQGTTDGYQITAVGQVPAITVKTMVMSLRPEVQATAGK